jgi:NTE family protein
MPAEPLRLAVVLSGGGSKGAFQVGVLDELVSRRGLAVDLYAGISTGAIQALGAAQDQIPQLRAIWEGIRSGRDIYKKRFLGLLGAVIGGADSLYDASPVRAKIRAFFDPAALGRSGKKLFVGAVSLRTGELVFRDETDPYVGEWVIASSAVPATYQPLKTADGDKWVDGGVRDITPLSIVLKQRPRAILIILASPRTEGAGRGAESYDDLVEIGLRAAGILANEVFVNDIERADFTNALIRARAAQRLALEGLGLSAEHQALVLGPLDAELERFRVVPIFTIEPARTLMKSTEFKPAEIAAAIRHGEEQAAAAWPMLQRFLEDAKRMA